MKIGNSAAKAAPATVTHGAPAIHRTARARSASGGAIPAKADAGAKTERSNAASTLLSGGATAEFHGIDDRTFKINPEAIADKLIANARELLSKVQR